MHRWTLVTVTFNSLAHLERHWTLLPDSRDFVWIVVDNGSDDGSVDYANRFADLVIETGANRGFAFGNNRGLARVESEFVAFVNPDVGVPAHGWQERLEATISRVSGLVAPQLLESDGSMQPNARGIPFLSAKVRNRLRPDSDKGREYARADFDEVTFCSWTMGAALAGHTETFRRVGGWCEDYFLYYEDHEIGLRAWQQGVPVALDPEVRWVHDWQRATSKFSWWAWRVELASMRTFFRRFPQLLWGARRTQRVDDRLRQVGLSKMLELLWQPAGTAEPKQ